MSLIPAKLKTEVGHAVALFGAAFVSSLGAEAVAFTGHVDEKVIVAAVVAAVVAAAHQVLAKFAPAAKK